MSLKKAPRRKILVFYYGLPSFVVLAICQIWIITSFHCNVGVERRQSTVTCVASTVTASQKTVIMDEWNNNNYR